MAWSRAAEGVVAARRRQGRGRLRGLPGRARADALAAFAFLLPNGLGFLVFTLLPIVASLLISFFDWPISSAPRFAGLANYARLFGQDPVFVQALANTLLFVIVYVPANVVVSVGLATWLTGRVKGAQVFRVLLFLPVVTPMVANAIVWTLIYAPNGILDWFLQAVHLPTANWLGSDHWAMPAIITMSVWAGFGYNMLVFTAGLKAIPRDMYDAAVVDGASNWQQFRRVTLPLLSPTLFFGVVLTLITSFQVFTQPYVLTSGGPGNSSMTLVLYLFNSGFQNFRMGYASAVAWVLFVVIMAVTAAQFLLQRKWVHYEV